VAADPTGLFTDRGHLAGSQYATGRNLAARQSIYQYAMDEADFISWAVDQVDWSGRVLDLGCGNGRYLRALSSRSVGGLVGADLSPGMVREVLESWEGPVLPDMVVADAEGIPFADGAFDGALAMHMLYHVPHMDRAVAELRRVVRGGGAVLFSTNGSGHLQELRDAWTDAAAEVSGGRALPFLSAGGAFELESGRSILAEAFERVERRDLRRELRIPAVEPIVDYLESAREWREETLPDGTMWEAVAGRVAEVAERSIGEQGYFRVRTHAGVFVCS
jgi:SAM-dependent methyltransferase